MLESTVRTYYSHSVGILLSQGGVAGDVGILCFLRFLVFYDGSYSSGRNFLENYNASYSSGRNLLENYNGSCSSGRTLLENYNDACSSGRKSADPLVGSGV